MNVVELSKSAPAAGLWQVMLDDGAGAVRWLTPDWRWSESRAAAASFAVHAAAWTAADKAARRLPDGADSEPAVIAASEAPPPRKILKFTPARSARITTPSDAQHRGNVVFLPPPKGGGGSNGGDPQRATPSVHRGPDLRGKETAAAACRMLRAGVGHERALRNLLDVNARRQDPLPAQDVRRILGWALRETGRRKRPVERRKRRPRCSSGARQKIPQ